MLPPEISFLVAGINKSLTHCSGNVILKRERSVISEIFGQLYCLHTPLVLWKFTSDRLGQMFGVTHFPMVWVSGVFGWAFSGAGSLSSSTSIPWWLSSAIYCESPPNFGATSATDSRSSVVCSRSGSWWAATTAITTTSSSKVVGGAYSILKLPQKMWKTVSSISGILHL